MSDIHILLAVHKLSLIHIFFDETGVPILYMDLTMQMLKNASDLFKSMDSFHAITTGAYKIMNRLEDVPLTTKYAHLSLIHIFFLK